MKGEGVQSFRQLHVKGLKRIGSEFPSIGTVKLVKHQALEAEITTAKAELARFDSTSPIRQKPTGIYADPFGRDYEREGEEIAIQRGEPSPEWATQARLDELYALFGNDLTSEAYTQMKRTRKMFINKIFGMPEESDIINDSPLLSEQGTMPKLDEKWQKWGAGQTSKGP